MGSIVTKRIIETPDFRIFDVYGSKGDKLVLRISKDTDIRQYYNILVFTEGDLSIRRLSGQNPEVSLTSRSKGYCTLDAAAPFQVLLTGSLLMTVETDFARWYCINRNPKREPINGTKHILADGEFVAVSAGRAVFLAYGTVEAAVGTNIQTFTAPYLLNIAADTQIKCVGPEAMILDVERGQNQI